MWDYGGTGTAVIRQDMTGMMDVRCFVVYFPAPHPQPGPVRPKICANAMFDVSFLWHSFTYLHAPFISYSFPTYPSTVSVILSPPPRWREQMSYNFLKTTLSLCTQRLAMGRGRQHKKKQRSLLSSFLRHFAFAAGGNGSSTGFSSHFFCSFLLHPF